MTHEQDPAYESDEHPSRANGRYVVLVGKPTGTSAPYLTLSKALTRLGRSVRIVPVDKIGRREWVGVLRSAEAVVLVHYGMVGEYLFDQLALAVTLNVPIVRWWVGTDVLNVLTQEKVRASAQTLDRIVSANVAVASHLVD